MAKLESQLETKTSEMASLNKTVQTLKQVRPVYNVEYFPITSSLLPLPPFLPPSLLSLPPSLPPLPPSLPPSLSQDLLVKKGDVDQLQSRLKGHQKEVSSLEQQLLEVRADADRAHKQKNQAEDRMAELTRKS